MEQLKYTEILQLNKAMTGTLAGKPYKIGVLSNVTVNSFKDILEYFCRINKVEPQVEIGNYDNVVQDSLAITGGKDMVVVLYEMLNITDAVGTYFEDIDDKLYVSLRQKMFSEIDMVFEHLHSVPSVVLNTFSAAFFIPEFQRNSKVDTLARELNSYIEQKKPKNFTLVDIDKVIALTGVRDAFDSRFYQSSKAPYSLSFFKQYCRALLPVILKGTGKLKKAIIFDCDNTLWKGILGEDGAEGIDMSLQSKTGREYNLVQQMAKFLSSKGVIVGVCSKNNPKEVDDIFSAHPDMVLRDESIVIKKVNWEDKATNLRAIASELNIGLDSLVFVDDSPFEVNLIREQLPEVLTLQVPTKGYADLLQSTMYAYFNLVTTGEDAKKTEMYKQQFEREQAKNAASSLEDYLASLEMEIEISTNNPVHLARIAQLTQKTNQFNLTTKRYTESQVEAFMQLPLGHVVTLSVKDKFGDNGLTGVCIVEPSKDDSTTVLIDSLLMSCRVIGRNIELVFLNYILLQLRSKGVQKVEATFIPTAKNAQVEAFYEKLGFVIAEYTPELKKYNLNLDQYQPVVIDYINIKEEIPQDI